jgi:multicomponent Na+:H+ antiporter subunit D
MSDTLILLPVLLQGFIAIVLMFTWQRSEFHRLVSIVGNGVSVLLAALLFAHVYENGATSLQAGSWAAPYGITFIADLLSASVLLLSQIAGFAVSWFTTAETIGQRLRFGYFAIFHFLLMGLAGAFIAGDLFNLYVWFELIIISSFVLLTLGGKRMQIEGAVKYFTLNMLASIVFLTAIALLYGATGTLNLAELSIVVPKLANQNYVQLVGIIFFTGFGIKAGVFPLYFWLPASYHAPPTPISAIFAGLLTKVGIYALIRVFTLVFLVQGFNQQLILWTATLTIIFGGIGALVQKNILKAFAYLIVCHIGYMVAGLGLGSEEGVAGSVYYMFHDIVAKTNLFLIAGLMIRMSGTGDLAKMGGLLNRFPKYIFLFAITFFSLIGIPPLSGFWPKIYLFKAAFLVNNPWTSAGMIAAFIFATFITLIILIRIWNRAIASESQDLPDAIWFNEKSKRERRSYWMPILLLSAVTLFLGFGAEFVGQITQRIAHELLNPVEYIRAVGLILPK